MDWKILVYETSRGEKPVEDFIKACQPSTIAKISRQIDLLEKFGSQLGMPHSKKLTSRLFELRIRGKQEVRIFYSISQEKVTLLHAFKKQTNKTPAKEIKVAHRRLT